MARQPTVDYISIIIIIALQLVAHVFESLSHSFARSIVLMNRGRTRQRQTISNRLNGNTINERLWLNRCAHASCVLDERETLEIPAFVYCHVPGALCDFATLDGFRGV